MADLPEGIKVIDPLELARDVNTAIRDYEIACDEHRRRESKRLYGHQGASIGAARPTEAGRVQAAVVVIRRYLGADSEA